jgi:hypothetical protein
MNDTKCSRTSVSSVRNLCEAETLGIIHIENLERGALAAVSKLYMRGGSEGKGKGGELFKPKTITGF